MRHTGGKAILVVEDERIVAKELQRTLTNLGYRVPATAATADDAIRLASRLHPDLVLLDIQLKGNRDGIQTAEVLRFRFDVPVVFLTAYADERTLSRAKITEPHGYLVKPVKDADLLTAIEIALHKKETEQRLRDRERWLSASLHTTGDASIATNGAGVITFMNVVAELLTALREQQVVGRPLTEVIALVDEQTRQPVADPIARVLADGKVVPLPEGVVLAGGDSSQAIEGLASPIFDGEHHVVGVTLVFREIGEQHRPHHRAPPPAPRGPRSTFAPGLAYELEDPLTAVVADASHLAEAIAGIRRDPTTSDPQLETSLSQVAARVEWRERVEIQAVMELAVKMADAELRPRARLVVELGRLPPVEAGELQLGQAFANLLRNAAEALEEGAPPRDAVHVSSSMDDAGRVVVAIRDTGCGMTPEVLARAFEPFFTTKPAGRNTGLGLAVAREIVRSHGGEILVETEVGVGSTFRVVLPAAGPVAD